MATKLMVQVPSYVYFAMPPALLQQLLNCERYDYSWTTKKFHLMTDEANYDIRPADDSKLVNVSKAQAEADLKAAEEVARQGEEE